jgi:uroporphyrinogen-III decarboxylase
MTSRERMILALEGEKPDRVPATIHQWQPYHLKEYMGGMSDIEAFRNTGLDAAITFYSISGQSGAQWLIEAGEVEKKSDYIVRHYRVRTPEGTLTFAHGENAMTTWVVDHLIKKDDDIKLLEKYRPVPCFDRKSFMKKREQLGDDGIMRTFIWGYQGGCWQDACELVGLENLILASYDKPDWVHHLLTALLEQKIKFLEKNFKGLPVDLVETGGGASSNTVISPDFHRIFCLPYDRKLHSCLKESGFRIVYHTCGGMKQILDFVKENGADASETLSPPEIGGDLFASDLAMAKEKLGTSMALIGGIDQVHVLPDNDKRIEEDVIEKFTILGKNGGYIMSACDHFFDLSPDRLQAYSRAAQKCIY